MTPEERAARIVDKWSDAISKSLLQTMSILDAEKLRVLIAAALRDAGPKVVSDADVNRYEIAWEDAQQKLGRNSANLPEAFAAGFREATRLNSIAAIEKLWPEDGEINATPVNWDMSEMIDWIKAELLRRLGDK